MGGSVGWDGCLSWLGWVAKLVGWVAQLVGMGVYSKLVGMGG
jgi:hypothetical protein